VPGDGTSEGSRARLGTLGHPSDWRYAGQDFDDSATGDGSDGGDGGGDGPDDGTGGDGPDGGDTGGSGTDGDETDGGDDTASDESDGSGDSAGPGLGPGAALAALGGAYLLGRRRADETDES
jgi:hypothetical protein